METKFKLKIPFMKNSRAAKNSAAAHRMRFGKDPYFDWTVILGLFIATIILSVSFAFALWHTVSAGPSDSSGISSAVSPVSGPSLNVAGLQKVITVQSGKSSTVSEYEHGYPGPADPSI
jgi:hypothetical protein